MAHRGTPRPRSTRPIGSAGCSSDDELQRAGGRAYQADLAGFVQCFAEYYRSTQPLHPERDFIGRTGVEERWRANVRNVVGLRWELVSSAEEGDAVWAELRWSGPRHDGSLSGAQGVIICTVRDGAITSGRLYMQSLDE
jgi:ketosteroid isomerase-like protein